MIYLSASSIRDFIHCSKMFYYRSNYPEEAIDTQEAAVGRLVHEAIEKYWNDLDGIQDYAEQKINEYSIDKKGQTKIYSCLNNFLYEIPDIKDRLENEDLVEYQFQAKLNSEVTIRGKIDRVITSSDTVIDWKTGGTKTYLSNDVQFIIYYMMYHKIFGKYPSVVQVNLSKPEITYFIPKKEYIDTLLNVIIPNIVERIKTGKLYREGYFNSSCFKCSYIGICSKEQNNSL